MHRVLVLGGGKIGRMIACLLAPTGDYTVTVGDNDESQLDALAEARAGRSARSRRRDAIAPALAQAMGEHDAVVSALSYARQSARRRGRGARRAPATSTSPRTSRRRDAFARSREQRARADLHAAVRAGAGLRLDRRATTSREASTSSTRCACASARCRSFRPNALEVQPHLVDRRPDQRILQPVRGDPRRRARSRCCRSKGSSISRSTACATRRSTRRGGLGTLCETLDGQGARAQLQDDPLRRPSRLDGVPGERAAARASAASCSRRSSSGRCRSRFRTSSSSSARCPAGATGSSCR